MVGDAYLRKQNIPIKIQSNYLYDFKKKTTDILIASKVKTLAYLLVPRVVITLKSDILNLGAKYACKHYLYSF